MSHESGKNGYHPVQAAEQGSKRIGDNAQTANDAKRAWQNSDRLLLEERCCCRALQRLANPYVFGVLVCTLNFLQAAAFSLTGSTQLSTIEKRFQLKTSELAPFLIVNDIMSVVMVLFVAYYGHTSHRPRLIGGGCLLIGVGFLLSTLPQFIYDTPRQFSPELGGRVDGGGNGSGVAGVSHDGQSLYPVCEVTDGGDAGSEVCTEEEELSSGSLIWQVAWIIVGQILGGVGAAPILPLAVTYMDDSLHRSSTSVYVAFMFVASSFGPLLGAGISGFCLSTHADFYKAPVIRARSGDPNWLGAWWLSFAIMGVLLLLVGVPIMMFPKKIGRRVKKAEDGDRGRRESEEEGRASEESDVGGMYRLNVHEEGGGKCAYLKGFLSALRRLVTNPTYVSLILGVCAMLVAIMGTIVFMVKYLETQFGLSASQAPMLFGIIMPPGSLIGNLVGGIVVKKLKLTKNGLARMVVTLKPFVFLLAPAFFFLGCNNMNIAGVTAEYPSMNMSKGTLPDLVAACNANCSCASKYTPICGSDGVTYATPCHAGCLAMVINGTNDGMVINGTNDGMLYTDCGCINDSSSTDQMGLSGDYEHVAIPGECPRTCNTLIPFIGVAMLHILLLTIVSNPGFMLQLRAVDEDDRSIAIGFTSMLLRLLGIIPSPLIFGTVIQSTCLLLQTSCGKTGNCLIYDVVQFRYVFYGLMFGLDFLSLVMFIVCYCSIRQDTTWSPRGFEAVRSANSGEATRSDVSPTNTYTPGQEQTLRAYKESDV